MTRILADVKLDFQDVLIVPKRSELSSRSEVVLERTYKFKNSGQTWTGIGIIASNMDGVGTLGMASALAPEKMLTALVKHYSNIALGPVFTDPNTKNNVIFSIGSSDSDYQKYKAFAKTVCQPLFLMVDVANGYSQKFIDFISKVRDENPTVVLIAGNVATPEMAEQLILSGADMAKIGVGCFVAGVIVKTSRGNIPIELVNEHDEVLSHDGKYHRVVETFSYINTEPLIKINGTVSTLNHKYFVLNKKYKYLVKTDDDIRRYAEWVEAKNLTTDFLLIS